MVIGCAVECEEWQCSGLSVLEPIVARQSKGLPRLKLKAQTGPAKTTLGPWRRGPPVLMHPRADVLHGGEAARHPGVGIELLHDGLSHPEVVGVASGLQGSPVRRSTMALLVMTYF